MKQQPRRAAQEFQQQMSQMTQMSLQPATTTAIIPIFLDDAEVTVDRQIRAFLWGNEDGHELLETLYGGAMDEPIPERLRALLRH